jgi:hypothetical protein
MKQIQMFHKRVSKIKPKVVVGSKTSKTQDSIVFETKIGREENTTEEKIEVSAPQ